MKTQIQLILATAALTGLIWVYADRVAHESVDFGVEVTISALPNMVPRIEGANPESPNLLTIRGKARGPKTAARRLQMANSPGGVDLKVAVPLPASLTSAGPHLMDIRDDVAKSLLREWGLQLSELSQTAITYTIDQIVRFKVNLDTDAGPFTDSLEEKPKIKPGTVMVRMLQSERDKISSNDLKIPIAEQLRTHSGELTAEFQVPLVSPWPGVDVVFEPARVTVSARLKQLYETHTLVLISVGKLLPWDWPADKYLIEWKDEADRTKKIDVQVPIGKSRALTNADVVAYVVIDAKDIPQEQAPAESASAAGGWRDREVRFQMPDEFKDAKIVSEPQTVKFRIKPRVANPQPSN